jgi:hypothetical protein
MGTGCQDDSRCMPQTGLNGAALDKRQQDLKLDLSRHHGSAQIRRIKQSRFDVLKIIKTGSAPRGGTR